MLFVRNFVQFAADNGLDGVATPVDAVEQCWQRYLGRGEPAPLSGP
jgi:hypothetical protein